MKKTIIITGGAGFIGTNLILSILKNKKDWHVVNIDKLNYSSNLQAVQTFNNLPNYTFIKEDIADSSKMERVFNEFKPDMIMHLAAESHVDRSIDNAVPFIQSNIVGTFVLLETARKYLKEIAKIDPNKAGNFRFHHISTDEVFGDLTDCECDTLFSEKTPYSPSSPYSASKAASDHLARAWHRTYDLPVIITNCSNNYGPYQFTEKLIPLMIINALSGKRLPVYGEGLQIRDWLYVDDHVNALLLALEKGIPGETYVIGGHNEKTNIEVVKTICCILDRLIADKPGNISSFSELITFVPDRPGHDGRYAIDSSKIQKELGWKPEYSFEKGMEKTVQWYLDNEEWRNSKKAQYDGKRLGLNNE